MPAYTDSCTNAPLVLKRFSLLCALKILFLRRDIPGKAIIAGDIDNRVKTLIDALRMPNSQNELVGDDVEPRFGDDPFFCLLADDIKSVVFPSRRTLCLIRKQTTRLQSW